MCNTTFLRLACAFMASALLITRIFAHSWIEEMTLIGDNGSFTGPPGYSRGNVLRSAPEFNDDGMVYLLPPNGRAGTFITATDPMCKPSQQTQTQTNGSPRLQASPGSYVALRYEENGHVTLPTAGKPANRGTVYVYGTTQSSPNDTFLGIHRVWNTDGTGGDKRGKLLATENFDDGRCYQINPSNISTLRQNEFKFTANQLMGSNLWCQNDIMIPKEAPSGQPYTLYWVWDWPTLPSADLPAGKPQMYTTCMDVDITVANSTLSGAVNYVQDQDLAEAAIPSLMSSLGSGMVMTVADQFPEVNYQTTTSGASGSAISIAAATSNSIANSADTLTSTPPATSMPAAQSTGSAMLRSNPNISGKAILASGAALPANTTSSAATVFVTVTVSQPPSVSEVTVCNVVEIEQSQKRSRILSGPISQRDTAEEIERPKSKNQHHSANTGLQSSGAEQRLKPRSAKYRYL